MKKIILTKGLPASGKTTWAKQQVEKNAGKYKRINKDDLREMLDGGRWSSANEQFVLLIRDIVALSALDKGWSVIIDDTNLHPKHVARVTELAELTNAEVEIKDFTDVSVEECIKRDLKRPNSVGEKVIRDMYKQFLKPKPEPIAYNTSLPDCIICDIDGTLAHMNGRSPYDWKAVGTDKVDRVVEGILEQFADEVKIILLSGRDGSSKEETKKWLRDNDIKWHDLFMRKADDMRKDFIVKQELYEKHIKGKYNVLFVLDDRDQVVKLWRDLGLKCLQVAEGDF